MSIPRDSRRLPDGRQDQRGVRLRRTRAASSTIEDLTGIRVDQYVEIGFGGFVDLVDAVDGIEICPKRAMKDPQANLNIKKGCQEVDGKTALGYARSRASALGDIDRARHQREVVSAIG